MQRYCRRRKSLPPVWYHPPDPVGFLPVPSRVALLRPFLILLAGWLVLEFVLLELLAARIGWGAVMIILSPKGGLGLIFLIGLTLFAARQFRQAKRADGIMFPLISGILVALPGLFPMLVGIALFSPSLRNGLRGWWARRSQPAEDPRMLELPATEWKEIGTKKPRKRAKSTKARLEGQPPSV